MESGLCNNAYYSDPDIKSEEDLVVLATNQSVDHILRLYFVKRKRVGEISEIIGTSHQYVTKVIKKYKGIMLTNLKKQVAER